MSRAAEYKSDFDLVNLLISPRTPRWRWCGSERYDQVCVLLFNTCMIMIMMMTFMCCLTRPMKSKNQMPILRINMTEFWYPINEGFVIFILIAFQFSWRDMMRTLTVFIFLYYLLLIIGCKELKNWMRVGIILETIIQGIYSNAFPASSVWFLDVLLVYL